MIPHAELIKELGISSKPNLSNILAKKQNIQPAAWEKFRIRFDISERINGERASSAPLTGAHVTLQDYIDLLKEKDKASQTDKDKLLSALEKLTEIYSTLNQVKINSDAAKERLDSIVDEVRSEHAVIMDSLDRVEKNPVGTNAKLAGNLEVDRRKKRQEKGRHANAGK